MRASSYRLLGPYASNISEAVADVVEKHRKFYETLGKFAEYVYGARPAAVSDAVVETARVDSTSFGGRSQS